MVKVTTKAQKGTEETASVRSWKWVHAPLIVVAELVVAAKLISYLTPGCAAVQI